MNIKYLLFNEIVKQKQFEKRTNIILLRMIKRKSIHRSALLNLKIRLC